MGLFSSIGSMLNDIVGTTSAAKQSQKYALQSAQVNNEYQKEFAQSGHQWEVEDLKKAGLNPTLSAGGSGASASGGGVNSATQAGSGVNPIDTLIGTINGVQSARKTSAEIKNTDATTALTNIQTQREYINFLIDSKASSYKINQQKQILENMMKQNKLLQAQETQVQKQIEKTVEETKQIKGGIVDRTLGTEPHITKPFKNAGRNPGKDPNKPNLFSNRKNNKPIRWW